MRRPSSSSSTMSARTLAVPFSAMSSSLAQAVGILQHEMRAPRSSFRKTCERPGRFAKCRFF
jgi:hypothetical protein